MILRVFHCLLFLGSMMLGGPGMADAWSDYTVGTKDNPLKELLINGNFNRGAEGWNLGEEFRATMGGRSDTRALQCVRQEDEKYTLATQPVELRPNTRYRLSGWIRTENMTGEGAIFCIEWYENGQYVGGRYRPGVTSNDWTLLTDEFTTVDNPQAEYRVALLIRKGSTGTAYFDDFSLVENRPVWNCYLINPQPNALTTEGDQLELGSIVVGKFEYDQSATPELACRYCLSAGDGRIWAEGMAELGVDNRFELVLDALPAGEYRLRCQLVDRANQLILAEKILPVEIVTPAQLSGRRVRIDRLGRTLVDGKPYLPLGLYFSNVNPQNLAEVIDSPFNCILPYSSANLTLRRDGKADRDSIREVLDYLAAHEKMIIFSLKDAYPDTQWQLSEWNGVKGCDEVVAAIVETYRDHPALLAWYSCDEMESARAGELFARRELLHRLDDNHPSWAVYYQYNDFPFYVGAQDIMGVDPYPIVAKTSRDQKVVLRHLEQVRQLQRSRNGTVALWVVPQAHNVGIYRKDDSLFHTDYRYPTRQEMLSIALLEAIYGARGFVFYSYFDLLAGPDEDQYRIRWPELKAVAAELKALEPFLLSKWPIRTPAIGTESGEINAGTFQSDDGRTAVLISAIGPGPAEATLEVGIAGLQSRCGNTTEIAPGVYRFAGEDICGDILR